RRLVQENACPGSACIVTPSPRALNSQVAGIKTLSGDHWTSPSKLHPAGISMLKASSPVHALSMHFMVLK
ncbi:MAG TPA: hypothetical protein VMC61_01800, partial [Methanocella sp.]|nr:hypothetical protein [Methanocella sp.]